MSKLQTEVQQCITKISSSDANVTRATLLFPQSFIGFDGHFEQQSILPGICKIQAVLAVASHTLEDVSLSCVKLAKFFTPVMPGDEITLDLTIKKTADSPVKLSAIITRGSDKIAKIVCLVDTVTGVKYHEA